MTTAEVDAFHLPGWDADSHTAWDVLAAQGGAVRLRTPRLTGPQLEGIGKRLIAARTACLERRPVDDIITALDGAAARLADGRHPLRQTAERLLPAITGYAPAMVQLILDRMSNDWRRPALERLLAAELDGLVGALDGFVPRRDSGEHVRAYGPRLAFHVFAGNVPGVAVTAMVRALLVKAAILGKTATGEPLLPVLFARALEEVDPELARCVAVLHWRGGEAQLDTAAFHAADLAVVYGGAEAITAARALAPAGVRIVEHGPKLSLAYIAAEMLEDDQAASASARAAARATATFDQQGCVSPHAVYVESGGHTSPREFAAMVAHALRDLETTLPRGEITAAEAAAIREFRTAAEFRIIAGDDVAMHAGPDLSFTVVYRGDDAFVPSCLNRTLTVLPCTAPAAFERAIASCRNLVQSLALAARTPRRGELAERFGALGFARITDLHNLPWPPPHAHHDGNGPLRELIRWTDLEDSST